MSVFDRIDKWSLGFHEAEPQRRHTDVAGIVRVMGAVRAGDVVEAVAPVAVEGDPGGEGATHRDIDSALSGEIVVIAVLALDVTVIPAVDDGIVGVQEHRAARRILPCDRALRSAQHLDVGDVVIRFFLEIAGEGGNAVAIGDHTRRRLGVVLGLADAADVELEALAEIVDRDARHVELQLVDGDDALVGEILAAQHRGRDRGRHQILGAALGGHHDLAGCARFIVGREARRHILCDRCTRVCQRQCGYTQPSHNRLHAHPPQSSVFTLFGVPRSGAAVRREKQYSLS